MVGLEGDKATEWEDREWASFPHDLQSFAHRLTLRSCQNATAGFPLSSHKLTNIGNEITERNTTPERGRLRVCVLALSRPVVSNQTTGLKQTTHQVPV